MYCNNMVWLYDEFYASISLNFLFVKLKGESLILCSDISLQREKLTGTYLHLPGHGRSA
jgi:hypothetical protein